ncbi:hypothetical protein ABPG77_010922 [Micractinium sp. CCAP 211/92]
MEAMVAWLQQALEQTRDKYRREGAAVTLYQEHRRLWAASVVEQHERVPAARRGARHRHAGGPVGRVKARQLCRRAASGGALTCGCCRASSWLVPPRCCRAVLVLESTANLWLLLAASQPLALL